MSGIESIEDPLLSRRLPHFRNPFVQEQQIIPLDMGENDSHFFISNIGHAAQSLEARTSTHAFDPHSCPRWQRFRRSNPASKETKIDGLSPGTDL